MITLGKSTYNNFIKSYDTIRNVLRHLYIYGCYSRDDFKNMGISGRKYDNERKRILNFINEKFVVEEYVSNTKYIGLKNDMFKSARNFLVDSYMTKTISENYINYFFLIQQILNQSKVGLSSNEIIDYVSELIPKNTDEKSTIIRMLRDMVNQGFIKEEKIKNKKIYSISDDFFKEFTIDEIIQIYYATDFYCSTSFISAPGYYLKDTIKKYLKYERNYELNEKEIYLLKDNFLSRIIDDEIIINILNSIINNKDIKIYYRNNKKPIICVPYKIITEFNYGRQYLLCEIIESNKVKLFRIDRINKIKENENIKMIYNPENYDEYIQNCWCVGFHEDKNNLIDIEIDFFIDDNKEQYIIQRILKEGKWGQLNKIKEGEYVFKIKVSDARELIPWIRSFTGFAKVRKSEQHNLYELIEGDRKESLKNYGIV